MTTLIKKTLTKQVKNNKAIEKYGLKPLAVEGTFLNVPLSKLDISPLNYRRIFDEQALQDFAAGLQQYGVLSPVTVRKMPSGRFELVAGERRFRAAKIAKLQSIPAMVKMLTDEQVTEIMLLENLQREDPHPLHEAQGIARMQKAGNSIDEIATRLGKSKTFIYCRLKWAELIIPVQEMFLANKISIKDATELSLLAIPSQQEFFDQYCKDWEKKTFNFNGIRHAISRFKYDLKRAPFDTKDKTLMPEAGACSRCPFNSATSKSLFPEYAKEATCSHKVCYKAKCLKHLENNLRAVIEQQKPDALISYGNFSEESQMLIDSLPEINALPEHSYYDVTIIHPPTIPDKEDYLDYSENEDGETNEEEYNEAMREYEADLAEHETLLDSGSLLNGLTIINDKVKLILFSPEKKTSPATDNVTAKQVQEAIKNGSITPELLEQEIKRIEDREKRAKEIDRNKVQKLIHESYKTVLMEEGYTPSLTVPDSVAARLIIFQSLDWSVRNAVVSQLFSGVSFSNNEDYYNALANLDDAQYAYLIRMAICGDGASTLPDNIVGVMLYRIAERAGFDVTTVEKNQQEKATEREEKLINRIAELERKIKKLKPAA